MKKVLLIFFVLAGLVIYFIINYFNHSYKVGNLIELGYPIETRLKTEVVRRYVDTLIYKRGYNVPYKWKHFDKLVDIDSNNNKRLYFQSGPEEMYLISYGGMLMLSDVYNPLIRDDGGWVAVRENMPKSEELRIKARFKEVLNQIEIMAHTDNLPDSIIYK